MKKSKGVRVMYLAAFVGLSTVLMQPHPTYAGEPRSYPMTCRAGGGMQAQLVMLDNGSAALTIRFKKGTAGASAGQCAWIDRGMRSNEPNELKLYVEHVKSMRMSCARAVCRYVGSRDRHLDYLMNAVVKGEPFQVHVYNIANLTGGGFLGKLKKALQGTGFRVTRVGP